MANEKGNARGAFKTSIGGQALIEGILMRGPDKQAIACRLADGTIQTKTDPLEMTKEKHPILGVPFLRGVSAFLDSMVKGMQALTYSAELLPEEEQEEPDKLDLWLEKHLGSERTSQAVIAVALVLGVALAIGLFVLLPAILFELLPQDLHLVLRCILEGAIRIVIFLAYLWFCTRVDDVKRLFSYHGAEHKTIYCYEKHLELTVENVRRQSRFHPRCGTSFLLVVMVIAILVVSVMTWVLSLIPAIAALSRIPAALVRILAKLIVLPLIVGITYEVNRWVGRHDENLLARIVAWPGKKLQHLTTQEPDDGMIECAITALKLVIPEEEGADEW
ncbi:MAG: DUF1385 domain-containing protein [Oscillospiraceae bacterium]|nr:DUF1385 domain-containing protein [Oscillospiraceae bacterium]